MKKILKISKWSLLGILVFVIASNIWIVAMTYDSISTNKQDFKDYDVALVFGTSRYRVGGGNNPFFQHRIETAKKLYELGVVKHFILSGDNNTKYYNEPLEMKKAMLEAGVPEDKITLDYAGFRTLDTVVRGKEIFGQDKLILITQRFHGYRALFIAQHYDLKTICFPASYPEDTSYKVLFREVLARTKAILDLYLLKKSPKFLGEKEEIIL